MKAVQEGRSPTSHHKPEALAGRKVPGREAMEGRNECQELRMEGWGGDRLGECGTPGAGFEMVL